MKSLKHFIWDFDGTLFDTYPNLAGYMQKALQDCGIAESKRNIHEQMLINVPHTIRYYGEKYNIPDMKDRYDKYYVNQHQDSAPPFPGVREVLDQIRANGGYNYIFTNRGESTYPYQEKATLTDCFREIITTAHPQFVYKPSPTPILYLMEKYGGTAEDTVMVGDRTCDLESGYNAGCKTIHLLTPDIPQYPPCDWQVTDFWDLLNQLR